MPSVTTSATCIRYGLLTDGNRFELGGVAPRRHGARAHMAQTIRHNMSKSNFCASKSHNIPGPLPSLSACQLTSAAEFQDFAYFPLSCHPSHHNTCECVLDCMWRAWAWTHACVTAMKTSRWGEVKAGLKALDMPGGNTFPQVEVCSLRVCYCWKAL